MKLLKCGSHGRVPWRGDVICKRCGRVYQTRDDLAPDFAPLDCSCGAVLMSNVNRDGVPVYDQATAKQRSEIASARAVCHSCFVMKVKTQG